MAEELLKLRIDLQKFPKQKNKAKKSNKYGITKDETYIRLKYQMINVQNS